MRDDFSEIYLALRRKGLLVSLFTNATLVREEHVELFRQCPPRDVEVTVYGATAETYERVTRRPGSFAAFERGLGLLLNGGIGVRLKAVAMRSNVHELPDIARFCRERTKDYFRFDPHLTLRLDHDEGRNREILAERLGPDEVVGLERSDPQRQAALRTNCALLVGADDRGPSDRIFVCGAGVNGFSVGWDGRFRLCSSLGHPDTTYDLRRGSLREAWEQVVPRVRDMRSRRAEFLDKCGRCPVINLCQWCPAHAELETGELDACPESFCQGAQARARSLKPTTE